MYIIHNKDIQKVFDCSEPTASRRINLVRAAYKKKPKNPVTLKEFCDYFELNHSETLQYLTRC